MLDGLMRTGKRLIIAPGDGLSKASVDYHVNLENPLKHYGDSQ